MRCKARWVKYEVFNLFTGQLRQQDYPSSVVGGAAITPDVTYAYHRNGGLKQVTDAANIRTFDYYEDWSSGNADLGHSSLLKRENLGAFYFSKKIDHDYHFGSTSHLNGLPSTFQLESSSVYKISTNFTDKNRISSLTPSHQSSASFDYSYVTNSNLVDKVNRDNNGAYEYHRDYDYESNSNRLARVRTDWNGYFVTDVMPRYDELGRLFYTEKIGDAVAGLSGYAIGLLDINQYDDRNQMDYSVKFQVATGSIYPNDNWVNGGVVAKDSTEDGYRDYTFDAIGNRILEDEHSAGSAGSQTTIERNSLNQYTYYAGRAQTYDYNGNLTSDGVRTYTYDAENQLTDVAPISPVSGDLKIFNQYDYMGRRTLKRVYEWDSGWTLRQDLTCRFVYDGWNLVAELDQYGSAKKKYTWGTDVSGTAQGAGGVGGLLMIELKQGSSYVQLYPIYDQGHNIIGLHNSSGVIVARYDYDTFGQIFKSNGNSTVWQSGKSYDVSGDSNYAEANPFRYSTKYTDNYSLSYGDSSGNNDGLVYYGLRFYDPDTGRFINRDPAQESGGLNLYGFVGNNPMNFWDYLGMAPKGQRNTDGDASNDDDGTVELDPFEVKADYNESGYLDYLSRQNRRPDYDAIGEYSQQQVIDDVNGARSNYLGAGQEGWNDDAKFPYGNTTYGRNPQNDCVIACIQNIEHMMLGKGNVRTREDIIKSLGIDSGDVGVGGKGIDMDKLLAAELQKIGLTATEVLVKDLQGFNNLVAQGNPLALSMRINATPDDFLPTWRGHAVAAQPAGRNFGKLMVYNSGGNGDTVNKSPDYFWNKNIPEQFDNSTGKGAYVWVITK